jgi:hypothetical protein
MRMRKKGRTESSSWNGTFTFIPNADVTMVKGSKPVARMVSFFMELSVAAADRAIWIDT